MKNKSTFIQEAVGLFIIVIFVTGIIYFVVAAQGGGWWKKKVYYKLKLKTAKGMKEGTEVGMKGMRIGEVTKLVMLPDNDIEITIRVKKNLKKICVDSKVIIERPLIFGSAKINILPGMGQVLSPGSYLILKQDKGLESSIIEILEKVKNVMTNLENTSTSLREIFDNIKNKKGTVGKLLGDEELYRNVNILIEKFAGIKEVLASLDNALASVPTTMENLQGVSGNLKESTKELPKILTDLQTAVAKLPRLLKDLVTTLDNVKVISANFNNVSGDLKKASGNPVKIIKTREMKQVK